MYIVCLSRWNMMTSGAANSHVGVACLARAETWVVDV